MRQSAIALVCGMAGIVIGSLVSDGSSDESSARWQYKAGVNPAW